MPPTTRAAAEACIAATAAAIPHDLLALVCPFLPPGDAALAVPRASKALAAAAACQVAEVQAAVAAKKEERRSLPKMDQVAFGVETLSIPLWALQEAWPQLRNRQRVRVTARAAFHGDLAVLQWAVPRLADTYVRVAVCEGAAAGGLLDALQCALELGCPWSSFTCSAAAGGGHLAVLRWARAQLPPCPWDEWTCEAAAFGGHLAVLEWLRAQQPPCFWGERTCQAAAGGGQLVVLQWARAQQPPCSRDVKGCWQVASDPAVQDWVREQAALEGVAL
jgi:hypothetical protein